MPRRRGGRSRSKRYFVPYCLPAETVEAEPLDRRGDGIACELLKCWRRRVIERLRPARISAPARLRAAALAAGHIYRVEERADLEGPGATRREGAALRGAGRLRGGERRRADIVLRREGRRLLAGFHERASQSVVDIGTCVVASAKINAALAPLRSAMAAILRDGTSADAVVNETDTGLDVLIRPHRRFDLTLPIRETLIALAESADFARVSWGDRARAEPVVVRRTPLLMLGRHTSVEPPPGVFLQATKRAELVMRAGVTAWAARALTSPIFSRASARCRSASRGRRASSRATRRRLPRSMRLCARPRPTARPCSCATCSATRYGRRNSLPSTPWFSIHRAPAPRAVRRTRRLDREPRRLRLLRSRSSFARDVRTLQDGGYRLEKLMPSTSSCGPPTSNDRAAVALRDRRPSPHSCLSTGGRGCGLPTTTGPGPTLPGVPGVLSRWRRRQR